MSLEEFLITVYCLADEFMTHGMGPWPLRSRGPEPKLLDAEVLTMEIVGEFLGLDTEKGMWSYYRQHWAGWFPALGSRAQFAKHAANLWVVKQRFQRWLAERMGAGSDPIHVVDGVPIAVCHFARAPRCRRFRGEANFGYCASKKETYYGFHGHLLINLHGVITQFTLTEASGSEREALWELVPGTQGLLMGDRGYLSAGLQHDLRQQCGIDLQTPLRSNMTDVRPRPFRRLLVSQRRRIETVLGQLTERFHLAKVWARDLWHHTSRIARKLLSHTVAAFLRDRGGPNCLDFDALLTH